MTATRLPVGGQSNLGKGLISTGPGDRVFGEGRKGTVHSDMVSFQGHLRPRALPGEPGAFDLKLEVIPGDPHPRTDGSRPVTLKKKCHHLKGRRRLSILWLTPQMFTTSRTWTD